MVTPLKNSEKSTPKKNTLESFLHKWDNRYQKEITAIPIFDTQLTKQWSLKQKQHFAKIFYHARGHFHSFLWFLGNTAPDKESKEMIIENIREEFGGHSKSHEQLYFDFANSLGVSLGEEIIKNENYHPYIQAFNNEHLAWLATHDWQECLAAFSAYERLDNLDYVKLYNLAESFGLNKTELVFFSVHKHASHFETTLSRLLNIWNINAQKVESAFNFIKNHQIKMWNNLSESILTHV